MTSELETKLLRIVYDYVEDPDDDMYRPYPDYRVTDIVSVRFGMDDIEITDYDEQKLIDYVTDKCNYTIDRG